MTPTRLVTPATIAAALHAIHSWDTATEQSEANAIFAALPAAPEDGLREALMALHNWDLADGSPCWCRTVPPFASPADESWHITACRQARTALANDIVQFGVPALAGETEGEG